MRVGMKLAEQMTNEQLDEFESFIDKNDEAGALRWLETNFPNYKQVVAYQLEALKSEIRQVAPQIIAASNAGQEDNAQTQTNPQVSHIQSQQQFQQPPIPHSDYQNSTDLNVQQQSTIPPDQSPPAPPVNI
jgi:septum formation inhibitor MinC